MMIRKRLLRNPHMEVLFREIADNLMTKPMFKVAIVAPKYKESVILLNSLRSKLSPDAISYSAKSYCELTNGSKVVASSIFSDTLLGSTCDLMFIDSINRVDLADAEEFFSEALPTYMNEGSEAIITHGQCPFERLWESCSTDAQPSKER